MRTGGCEMDSSLIQNCKIKLVTELHSTGGWIGLRIQILSPKKHFTSLDIVESLIFHLYIRKFLSEKFSPAK